ncbi:MAG: phosphatidylserine/phosphatidylglycerophosphate/cardiolipin synthase family protein [Erysipelotrichales bacterium]|nr:phosphatidylserine/phosphatidylglycerophosphate/cardiolipin synthase family protein [Erysipelotrichales bacterium]
MDNIQLLVDGKEAFPMILECIQNAKESIYINMFLWRCDKIGNELARALLEAADRGVQITISKDQYGIVLEYSEEDQSSFFHDTISLLDRVSIAFLCVFYNNDLLFNKLLTTRNELAHQIYQHPNITLDIRRKYDHSKFYIFDHKTLILGGINVEDKENGADRQGRVYQDYMVKIDGEECVREFLRSRDARNSNTSMPSNQKEPFHKFEIEQSYLDMIRESREYLFIQMAYFSPLPIVMKAIEEAYQRGVEITVMIPNSANFTDDLNKKTVKEIYKMTHGEAKIYLTPKMAHTKLVMNENRIHFGSSNINKKAFYILDEQNMIFRNDDCAFAKRFRRSVEENMQEAVLIRDIRELKYNKWKAILESILM